MLSRPSVGDKIAVVSDYTSYMQAFDSNVPRIRTLYGEVVASAPDDDPETLRLLTNDPYFPVSVVKLSPNVTIRKDDGSEQQIEEKKETENRTWQVEGSKGNSYVVSKISGSWLCSCPGFGFRRQCKHVVKVKTEYLAEQNGN